MSCLSKIFSGQYLGCYRCKSQLKRAKRQNEVKISRQENWKSDGRLEFHAKKFQRKCFSFFDFPTRRWSDLTLKFIFRSNMLFCLKFGSFQCLMIILTMIHMEYQKKKDTFLQQFLVACYATLHPALSVGWLVGQSVGRSPFYFFGVF